jgi:hypothetical protein
MVYMLIVLTMVMLAAYVLSARSRVKPAPVRVLATRPRAQRRRRY